MVTKVCFVCGTVINDKNHVGINTKLLGRRIERFFCIKCLADHYEITTEELLDKIEDFKAQGCALFE